MLKKTTYENFYQRLNSSLLTRNIVIENKIFTASTYIAIIIAIRYHYNCNLFFCLIYSREFLATSCFLVIFFWAFFLLNIDFNFFKIIFISIPCCWISIKVKGLKAIKKLLYCVTHSFFVTRKVQRQWNLQST